VNVVNLGRERSIEPVERVDGLPVETERAKWSRFSRTGRDVSRSSAGQRRDERPG
jgi:hypothetical protein